MVMMMMTTMMMMMMMTMMSVCACGSPTPNCQEQRLHRTPAQSGSGGSQNSSSEMQKISRTNSTLSSSLERLIVS
eukprot:611194-Karenia_brevis.AAC.1